MLWPSKDLCPECWRSESADTEWDTDAVYEFLKSQYWAEDTFVDFGGRVQNEGQQVPKQHEQGEEEPTYTYLDKDLLLLSRGPLVSSNVFSFVIVPIGAVAIYAMFLKWEKDRLGKMKKFDDDGGNGRHGSSTAARPYMYGGSGRSANHRR